MKTTLMLLFFTLLLSGHSFAQDMWGFSRYAVANEKIGLPEPGEKRIVFLEIP